MTSLTSSSDPALGRDESLCAEFAAGVSLQQQGTGYGTGSGCGSGTSVQELSRYGRKLGFSSAQVERALALTGAVDHNTLLQHLVLEVPGSVSSERSSSAESDEEEPQLKASVPGPVEEPSGTPSPLRHIVIDGSNVAMSHGNKQVFSCSGIRLAVDYFRSRGHSAITVFVPMWRKEASRADSPISDGHILLELEREKVLVFTPSRVVDGRRITCYDDRYILRTAVDNDGIVVSNDNYRDLHREKQFKKIIEERILMYSFVNDRFMPPEDPLGKSGPTLDVFLRRIPLMGDTVCPYGKKCTYGNKCKYNHPERAGASARGGGEGARAPRSLRQKTLSLPPDSEHHRPVTRTHSLAAGQGVPPPTAGAPYRHRPLSRQLTLSPAADPGAQQAPTGVRRLHAPLRAQLSAPPGFPMPAPSNGDVNERRATIYFHLSCVFPEYKVQRAMQQLPHETDPNRICSLILRL